MTSRPLPETQTGLAKGHRAELGFMLRFGAIAGTFMAIYAFPYDATSKVREYLGAYLAAYAHAAGAVLHLLDPAVHVSGSDISGRFSLRIVKDCDAMDVNILFAAAVLAFPARGMQRAFGLAAGGTAILVANVGRICALYFIGVSAPDAFEFAHRDIFPLLLVALATLVFFPWARHVRKTQMTPSSHAAA